MWFLYSYRGQSCLKISNERAMWPGTFWYVQARMAIHKEEEDRGVRGMMNLPSDGGMTSDSEGGRLRSIL